MTICIRRVQKLFYAQPKRKHKCQQLYRRKRGDNLHISKNVRGTNQNQIQIPMGLDIIIDRNCCWEGRMKEFSTSYSIYYFEAGKLPEGWS